MNLAFVVAFVGVSEAYKTYLIQKELVARTPECIRVSSFLASVANAGGELQFHAHAIFVEQGRNYYWSYSEMSFFEGNDRLDRNFPCATR